MHNENSKKHFGSNVDLSVNDTRKILNNVKYRIYERKDNIMSWPVVEIFYLNKWRVLGNTTLLDDVRTGSFLPKHELFDTDPIKHYRETIQFGARFDDFGFWVVSGCTDG